MTTTKQINIPLPTALLVLLDNHLASEFGNRSDFIRRAIINQIRSEQAISAMIDKALDVDIAQISGQYSTDKLVTEADI